jgi:hypothetical protein
VSRQVEALALVLNSRCTSGRATGIIDVFSGLSMAASATVLTAVRADGRVLGNFMRDLHPANCGVVLFIRPRHCYTFCDTI